MQTFKQVIKYGSVLSVFGLGAAAHAEVPKAIADAIAAMQQDGVTVATAFVVAALAVAAIKFLRSAK